MPGDWPLAPGPWLALARTGVAYLAGVRSLRRRRRPWATALFVGGLVGLYFTPLYDQTLRHPLLHELVDLHFMAAGCLFAWTFIGVDPVPRRGSFAVRIGLLLFALGSHAALAKLLYAGYGDLTIVSTHQLHDGAQFMYYAGDAVDALLLVAFFGQWYAAGGRRLKRERRRAAHPSALPVKPVG